MKKKQNTANVISNVSGLPIINLDTGEFYMQFSNDQKKVLKEALENNISIRGVAFMNVPADVMKFVLYKAFNEHYNPNKPIADVELWKILHSTIATDAQKVEACIIAVCNGVSMLDEIENINVYNIDILNLVAKEAKSGHNICSKVSPTTTYGDLLSYAESLR